MELGNGFYLSGFERRSLGEAGAVFVRYEETDATPRTRRQPEIEPQRYSYYGARSDMDGYLVYIPKPAETKITGYAIVQRTSKNRWSATVHDLTRIETLYAETGSELSQKVRTFFAQSQGGGI